MSAPALGVPERRRTHAVRLDAVLGDVGDLARALGGDDTSFTGDLLRLIAKADVDNRPRLALAFPRVFIAWNIWMYTSPAPTAGELLDRLAAALGEDPHHRREGGPRPVDAAITLRPAPVPECCTLPTLCREHNPDGYDAWAAEGEAVATDPDPDYGRDLDTD